MSIGDRLGKIARRSCIKLYHLFVQNKMIEPELLTEVPAALKRLAKQVVRGFYGMDHALALDVLIRNPCVREEDMLELLKFDRKQLRSVLNTLKADKFVKCRMRVETAPDGKTTRHNYYFINYRCCSSFTHNAPVLKQLFPILFPSTLII